MQLGHTETFSFKVNVVGTSMEPIVRLAINTVPEIAAHASKSGDTWSAALPVPPSIAPGTYELRIEVILNNRLFTPAKRQVVIDGDVSVTAELPAAAPVQDVATDVSAPADVYELPSDVEVGQEIELTMPKEEQEVKPEKPSLLKSFTSPPVKPIELPKIKQEAAKPAPIKTPLPKPNSKPAVPLKLTISELAKVAGNRPVEPRTAPAPVVEMQGRAPVRLIKGEVIFE